MFINFLKIILAIHRPNFYLCSGHTIYEMIVHALLPMSLPHLSQSAPDRRNGFGRKTRIHEGRKGFAA